MINRFIQNFNDGTSQTVDMPRINGQLGKYNLKFNLSDNTSKIFTINVDGNKDANIKIINSNNEVLVNGKIQLPKWKIIEINQDLCPTQFADTNNISNDLGPSGKLQTFNLPLSDPAFEYNGNYQLIDNYTVVGSQIWLSYFNGRFTHKYTTDINAKLPWTPYNSEIEDGLLNEDIYVSNILAQNGKMNLSAGYWWNDEGFGESDRYYYHIDYIKILAP